MTATMVRHTAPWDPPRDHGLEGGADTRLPNLLVGMLATSRICNGSPWPSQRRVRRDSTPSATHHAGLLALKEAGLRGGAPSTWPTCTT